MALLEDDLALVVHDVVIFQEVLADVEVACLDLLCAVSSALLIQGGRSPRLPSVRASAASVHAVGAEDAHQVVLQRQVELSSGRGRPGARNGRAAGYRCGGFRGARCQHVEAAGGEHLLLRRCDFRLDRAIAASRSGPSGMSASAHRSMRMSRLPPSWMSVPRPAMLVAMVTAPGAGLRDDMRLAARGGARSAPVSTALFAQVSSARAARTSRSRSCRRAPAGHARALP
jgi:hypothetical protein